MCTGLSAVYCTIHALRSGSEGLLHSLTPSVMETRLSCISAWAFLTSAGFKVVFPTRDARNGIIWYCNVLSNASNLIVPSALVFLCC